MAASKYTKTVSDQNFEQEVLQSSELQVVDFWAEWCGPCRMLGPTIDALAEEFQGRVGISKLNVDENPATPPKYNIRGIPAVLLFKNGQLVDQIVGAVPKDVLARAIEARI